MRIRFPAVSVRLLFFITFVSFTISTHAQPGALDLSLNVADKGYGYGDIANGMVRAIEQQSDGKVIIAGDFTSYNGVASNRILRLHADGRHDDTFDAGVGANGNIYAIAIQTDGKVVVGGNFTTYNGIARNHLARLNKNGSLDETFNSNGGANDNVQAIAIDANGKVLISGDFTTYADIVQNRFARLNTDGSLDITFVVGTGINGAVDAIEIQRDGKIIIAGGFMSYNGTARKNIARLNTNGSLDLTFASPTELAGRIKAVAIQPDGKIVIGGYFVHPALGSVARLNADGSVDYAFAFGTGINGEVHALAIQEDGKVIVAGDFYIYSIGAGRNLDNVARLKADGSLDTEFISEIGLNFFLGVVSLQSDGKIIIGGGSYNGYGRHIVRLNTNGSLDVLFAAGTGANGAIHTVALQSDGKIIIGGDFTSYNGAVANHIARLNVDGTLDTSFAKTSMDSAVYTAVIQDNGKIIIGGRFEYCNDRFYKCIARLNADGSLDETFKLDAVPWSSYMQVYAIAVQKDGKIIMGGNISKFNGTDWEYSVIRLNTNGSIDASFNLGSETQLYWTVYSVVVQDDGKIVIGGNFSIWNEENERRSIARLNTDGSWDTSFNPGTKFEGNVHTLVKQPDGKIIVGGVFMPYGTTYRNISRLNINGSIDDTFNPGIQTYDYVYAAAVQNDGKIIIGGEFTTYNSIARNRIARLDADGSLDATFDASVGPNAPVHTVALQNDGRIIIGGDFTAYSGTGRNRIARVWAKTCVDPTAPTLTASAIKNCGFMNTTLSIATGELNSATEWKWYSGLCGGEPVGSGASITVSPAATTTYYVRGEGDCVTPGNCASITITVNSQPDITTTLNGTTVTANQAGATYQWLNCNTYNSPIEGATGQSYVPEKSGDFAVAVTMNGCTGKSACVNVIITSTEEMTGSDEFTVYPNPSNGLFTVESLREGIYSVKNNLGQTIRSFRLEGPNNYTWSCENLSPGIYFISATGHQQTSIRKIVISR